MRLFLALDASEITVGSSSPQFKKLKVSLNKKNMEFRWIPHEHFHVPMLQLGDFGWGVFHQFEKIIGDVADTHVPFEIKLHGLWAYPYQAEARVIWIGTQYTRELKTLRTDLLNSFKNAGLLIDDKEYKPSLPVVRLRNHRDVTDVISPYKNMDFGSMLVNHFSLYEMVSGGAYPTYKKIKDYFLPDPQPKLQLIS